MAISSCRVLCASVIAAASAGSAAAHEAKSSFTTSGAVSLVSDYRFRGRSLSDEDPAVQGTVTVSHSSGLYAGTWASSIEDSSIYGHTEVDLYGGWTGKFLSGSKLDVGLAYYSYANGNKDAGNSDFAESYTRVSRSIGPVTGTVGVAYVWAQSAVAEQDNFYLFGDASAAITGTPVTLKGHLGHSDGSLAPTGKYTDWSLGADIAAGSLTLGFAYVDNDLRMDAGTDATVLFSISAAF